MKLHHHYIAEHEREPKRYRWYPRLFLTVYDDAEERQLTGARVEFCVPRKLRREAGVHLHIGGLGSETPWDGNIGAAGVALFWGLEFGAKLAERITHGKRRDIGIRWHDGTLWVSLWEPSGEWSRDQPKWWYMHFSTDPTEWLWGRRRYTYDKVGDPLTVTFTTAEGTVHDDVVLQLEHGWRGWERKPRPKGADSWSVAWDSKEGIPTQNHDWKGDCTYGSSVSFTDAEAKSDKWSLYAMNKMRVQVSQWRLRSNWKPRIDA